VWAGAPLERIGKCVDAVYVGADNTSIPLFLNDKAITAIPADAFKACGKPE
jgi:hypothetical protein